VSDPDQTVTFPVVASESTADLPEPQWNYDDFAAGEDRPISEFSAGLASLPFIRAALRRSAWLWSAIAMTGMLLGFGIFTALPPSYSAATSLLVTNDPNEDPISAMLTDQTIAQSREVAQIAMRRLGLQQSIDSFVAATTVTVVTNRVLRISVSAPSYTDAVQRANALATSFLQFRNQQLDAQQKLILARLDKKIAQARQQLKATDSQISQVSAQPASPSRDARLSALTTKRSQQKSALGVLQTTTEGNQANTQVTTATMEANSLVLDAAAPVVHSRKKLALIYVATGLIAGLAIGLGLVAVRALVSDRLRRRDDVANALSGSVRLSTGTVHVSRWVPGRRGFAAARRRGMQRIVAHLGSAVPGNARGAATLAVVPVDSTRIAALAVASLAVSCAHEGHQVIVADLCAGAPAARLLRSGKPGFRAVRIDGARLLVTVPDRRDAVPAGPLRRTPPQQQGQHGLAAAGLASEPAASPELAAAFASADLLLTLIPLDPSLGGDHLATWATDAVAMMTAGKSSSTKIHATGEMIRLAGANLVSAVLIGADKQDESLGITRSPSPPPGPGLGVIGR
jgi:capsular polysaccharide biosynthesis protein